MKFIIPCVLLFISSITFSQQVQPFFDWVAPVGNDSIDYLGGTAVDSDGFIVTVGSFQQTVDFDPNVNQSFNLTSLARADAFIQKLDTNGNLIWAKQLKGDSVNNATGVLVDANGNIFVLGSYSGTVDFDPGAGTHFLTSSNVNKMFVLKLSPLGEFLWLYQPQNLTGATLSEIFELDPFGGVYIAGEYSNSVDFDPNSGSAVLNSPGAKQNYFLHINANGDFNWVKSFGPNSPSYPKRLKTLAIKNDINGNVIIGGSFNALCDFNFGSGTVLRAPKVTNTSNGFILSVSPTGSYNWVKIIESTEPTEVYDLLVSEQGKIIATGYFRGDIDLDPSSSVKTETSNGLDDIFVLSLNYSGNYVSSFVYGSIFRDRGFALTEDNNGNVYLLGEFQKTIDFDPGTDSSLATASVWGSMFVQKMDSSNQFKWVRSIETSAFGYQLRTDINVLPSNSIVFAGRFKRSLDFDFGSGQKLVSSKGNWDIFVTKWSQRVPVNVQNVNVSEVLTYPNPFSNSITVSSLPNGKKQIRIVNLQGAVISDIPTNRTKISINLKGFSKGMYFVYIHGDDSFAILKKIIKQ